MLSIKSYGTSICSVPWFCSEDVLKLFKGTDEFLQRAQTWASDNITIHDDDDDGDDDDGDDGDGVGVVGGDDHSDYDDGDDEYYISSDNIFLGNLLRITSWIPRSTIFHWISTMATLRSIQNCWVDGAVVEWWFLES